MTHEPDHKQFEMLLVDERDDSVDRMTGKQVGFERNTGCLCLSPRRLDHGCEPMVRFGLFLLHFVDARGKPRQLFHRDHVKRRTIPLCRLDRARKRLQRPRRAVVRYKIFRYILRVPAPRRRSRVWLAPLL